MFIYKKISFNICKSINTDFYVGVDYQNTTRIFDLRQNLNLKKMEIFKGSAIFQKRKYKVVIKDNEKSFWGYYPLNGNISLKGESIADIKIHTTNEYEKYNKKCCDITLRNGDIVTIHKENENTNNRIYLLKANEVIIFQTVENISILKGIKELYLGFSKEAEFLNYDTFNNIPIETQVTLLSSLAFWMFFAKRFESQFTT